MTEVRPDDPWRGDRTGVRLAGRRGNATSRSTAVHAGPDGTPQVRRWRKLESRDEHGAMRWIRSFPLNCFRRDPAPGWWRAPPPLSEAGPRARAPTDAGLGPCGLRQDDAPQRVVGATPGKRALRRLALPGHGDDDPARLLRYLVAAIALAVDAQEFGEGVLAALSSARTAADGSAAGRPRQRDDPPSARTEPRPRRLSRDQLRDRPQPSLPRLLERLPDDTHAQC